jgi:hypothetical protein
LRPLVRLLRLYSDKKSSLWSHSRRQNESESTRTPPPTDGSIASVGAVDAAKLDVDVGEAIAGGVTPTAQVSLFVDSGANVG